MARKVFIAGNWKMNKTAAEAKALCEALKESLAPLAGKVEVAVCPTFTSLATAVEVLKGSNVKVGAQNIHWAENGAFTGCDNLESVDIDGNVSTIGQQAFSGCRELTHISVHSVETIGYRAFYECSGLTTVDLPGIKYLNMGAFRGCTNLETIELESVITIDDNAFMDCYSLNSVVISEYCTMIGEGAFCNATSLETVYCYAVLPPFIKTDNTKGSYVFDSTSEDLCIYIPLGSLDDYIDEYYFEDHEYDDPIIMAHINWWYQEYEHLFCEMGTEAEVETEAEDGADEKIGAEIE